MKKASTTSSSKAEKEFILVIPNIRSAHNIGSLFRSADGAGVSKIYIAGYSPLPLDRFGRISKPQKEIAKTALGAEKSVSFEYFPTLKDAIKKLKNEKFTIIGLEQDEKAIKIESRKIDNKFTKILTETNRVALVVGEEVNGMTKADLKMMDHLIELPMRGTKESLNVSVAGGIALYLISSIINPESQ